ncbi:MAG TPA: pitrilysin family protein [Mycobacteriales bacterium]|nr:pitrilysin family protein [Mycobacteriales bacterium]
MPTLPHYAFSLHTLDNGLRVVISEDHLAPVVAVNVWYDVGSRHESPGHTGFAHLFEHLMFQGSRNVGRSDHFGLVSAAGGTLNGTTWCDRTNYYETVPANHLETALWLEADRMGGLLDALDQDNLDNQREVVKNEKRQTRDNQPYGRWLELLHELGYPEGHPYQHSTIGSMADLDAASLEDARAFYATWYAPDNAVLSIVGDVDGDAALAAVRRYFGGIPAKGAFPPAPPTEIAPVIGTEIRQTVPDRVPLPRLFIGYRCPPFGSPGFDVVEVLSAVLGGGRGSRLYKALVLDRPLLQPPDGSVLNTWPFVGGAALVVADLPAREGVDPAELEAAYHDVVAGLADGVTDDELDRAKALLTSDWLHHLATVDGRADMFSQFTTLFDDPGLVNEMLPRMLAVTADDVRRAAADVLRPDNRVVLLFEPSEDVDDEEAA